MRLAKLTTIAAAILGSAIALSALPAYATEGGKILREKTIAMIARKAAASVADTAHWSRVQTVINETPDEAFDMIDFAFTGLCSRPITKKEVMDAAIQQTLLYDQKLSNERVEWKRARALSEAVSITVFQSAIKNCPVLMNDF